MTNEGSNPEERLIASLITYIAYIMYTKMNLYFVILASLLGGTIFMINQYLEYWKKTDPDDYKNSKLYKIRKKQKDILEVILISVIILGFVLYFLEKKEEYKEEFDYIKFIFGKNVCSNNTDNALLNYLNK